MKNLRIIPRLDIKGPNLVKGVCLEGLRVLGDPVEFSKLYFDQGADEIFYQDVVASLYERNSLLDLVSEVSKKIFVPLTVGGGIRTIEDIRKVLKSGADKVSINTAATKNLNFIAEAASIFGSSTILVSMEVLKKQNGKYYLFVDNGREETGLELFNWIDQVQNKGVGEIAITFIEKEGTKTGYDIELIKKIRNKIKVPLLIHGGAGKIDDLVCAYKYCNDIDGFLISSILHYNLLPLTKNFKGSSISEGNINFIEKNKKITSTEKINLNLIKKRLSEIKGVFIRN